MESRDTPTIYPKFTLKQLPALTNQRQRDTKLLFSSLWIQQLREKPEFWWLFCEERFFFHLISSQNGPFLIPRFKAFRRESKHLHEIFYDMNFDPGPNCDSHQTVRLNLVRPTRDDGIDPCGSFHSVSYQTQKNIRFLAFLLCFFVLFFALLSSLLHFSFCCLYVFNLLWNWLENMHYRFCSPTGPQ